MGGGEAFGPYHLLRKLGSGGMAEVFLARGAPAAAAPVAAVKRTLPHLAQNPAVLRLFEREQRVASALRHPHIARIYEVGKVAQRPFFAMELVLGTSLAGLRKRSRTRPADALGYGATIRLLRDLCDALHHAHDVGDAPHGDVHLHNVMVTYDGVAKVIDFGLARAAGEAGPGLPGGTYAYMAPESLQGQSFDRRADVFSTGAVAWELFTGVPLFRRRTQIATMRAVVETPPPRLGAFLPKNQAHAAERLDAVLARALAKRPADRFDSCDALSSALADAAKRLGWCRGVDLRAELVGAVCGVFANERAAVVRGIDAYGSLEAWAAARPGEVPLNL